MGKIKCLFLDIGGVLLTNGWDHSQRAEAIKHFGLDPVEFQDRHKSCYDLHEQGKISLDEYLDKTVFYESRPFAKEEFRQYMRSLSKPDWQMIRMVKEFKGKTKIRMAVISNEGRDLIEYRIRVARMDEFIDDFFVSCFVGFQKPDSRIFQAALDITQMDKKDVLYIDDRPNLVEAANKLGIPAFVNEGVEKTGELLKTYL